MREVMVQYLQHRLLKWFDENQRIFPWREDRATKYQQIVSEILLQRTKAETVAKYYDTFFFKFPDWNALANASLEELEEIMKPLGLYRHRARPASWHPSWKAPVFRRFPYVPRWRSPPRKLQLLP